MHAWSENGSAEEATADVIRVNADFIAHIEARLPREGEPLEGSTF